MSDTEIEQRTMTPAGALAIQRRCFAADQWVTWLVSTERADHPGKVVAWAVVADHSGGRQQGGELVADTLEELRRMLPAGLTRSEALPFWWRGVVETWD